MLVVCHTGHVTWAWMTVDHACVFYFLPQVIIFANEIPLRPTMVLTGNGELGFYSGEGA